MGSRTAFFLFGCILAILASIGCGSGSQGPVISTSHPLVAQYDIPNSHMGATAWVEFGPDTNYGRQTWASSGSNSGVGTISILVAGMKQQTTYHMRAHLDWSGGSWVDQDRTFTTGAIPASTQLLPSATVTRPTPSLSPAPGVELLSIPAQTAEIAGNVALDLQGNVIWYCPGGSEPIKPLPNGDFIINTGTDLVEVDLACNTVRDVSYTQVDLSLQSNGYDFTIPSTLGVPGGGSFHHEVLVLPNGNWLTFGEIAKSFTDLPGSPGTTQVVGDVIVDIDPSGNVVWAWNSFDHPDVLDVNRHLAPYPDWTHSNALVYLPEDGNLLVSMRHQSWILKLDYNNGSGTGNILWHMGYQGDIALDQGTDPSLWFSFQHFPSLISQNGALITLAVWDNGDNRVLDTNGTTCGTPTTAGCYSRATIFQIDETTMSANLLWYDLPNLFSVWGGSINQLENGNLEFDVNGIANSPNIASEIQEVTPSPNPQVVWKMDLPTPYTAYRGYRIPSLYPGVTWQQ